MCDRVSLSLHIIHRTYSGSLALTHLSLPLARLSDWASARWASVVCIPPCSLLTKSVTRVSDSFTWGLGERIPRRLLPRS